MSTPSQHAGLRFGKYIPIAELGRGGMADVYLSVTQGPAGFSKLLVVKKLRATLADDPEFVTMLLDEARISARLNHPNVVQTYEVGSVEGEYFIAMEYLEGQPLHRIVRRAQESDKYDPNLQYRIISEVLAGLHHAHELRDYDGTPLDIVHRDISPHNIFVTYDGQVKVVDFGIAKAAGRISAATREGVVKGKMRYMAPEQALGRDVDRRSDVFSVGVLLWTAATGKRFWDGLDELTIVTRLIKLEIPMSPRDVRPDIPEAVDRICQRALSGDPAFRYATAFEMQSDIEAYLASVERTPSTRDVGTLVTSLFEKDRAEVRAVVEQKLAELDSPMRRFQLASMVPSPEVSSSGTSNRGPRVRTMNDVALARHKQAMRDVGDGPAAASGEPIDETVSEASRVPRASEPTRAVDTTGATFHATTTRSRPTTARSKTPLLLLGGGLLSLATGIAFFMGGRSGQGAANAGRGAPSSATPTTTPTEGIAKVLLPSSEVPSALLSAPVLPTKSADPATSSVALPVRPTPLRQGAATARATTSATTPSVSVRPLEPNTKEPDDGLSTRK